MESIKVLRMTCPMLTSYNCYGSMLSIISHNPETLAWVYSTFIQLIFDPKTEFLDFCEPRYRQCPWVFRGDVKRDLIHLKWSSVTDFIVDCINNDNYVHVLFVDRFYIPGSDAYDKYHQYHEIFIYGYDIKRGVFHCADNIKAGKYVHFECLISQFEKAFDVVEKSKNDFIVLLKYQDSKFHFDVDSIAYGITKYICPDNVLTFSTLYYSYAKNHVFGQDIYDHIVRILEDNRKKIDIRIFHLMWEHKHCMLNRIRYMGQHRYLNKMESIVESFEVVERKSLVHRNMILKYNLTGDKKIIHKLIPDIQLLKLKEKSILEEMLDNIVLGQHA